ncbi:4-coumarate--CoA ligase 1 isoform X1 [Folsomia candida]|uniref:4-coumarate--CoA ligase 1 isoform X2 n=1 Tax=Folsomia candida TaxID=158441 RepID=UPI000B8F7E0C|nr:4-coumarate--CoA ligase 1 isoform X2 [Folsomia candida]XP_035716407.1 4-coumarate--CoA ligase 1 isoform X1 [Folsomia candida]
MSSLYRTFGGTLRSLNSLTQAGGKRVRCFSTPAAAASSSSGVQDDPSLWVRSVLPDVGLIKGVNTAEYTFENISKWENVTAFECGVSGRSYTYLQLYKFSRNFGAALLQSGLKKGDVLAMIIPNMPEFPIALHGTWWAGLVPTFVNPTYTATEISNQLKDCKTKCVVTFPLFVPLAQQVIAITPELADCKVIVIGGDEAIDGCHSFGEMIKTDSSGVNLAKGSDSNVDLERDTAALLYSSGTTGLPKGCMLTHHSLVNNVHQFLPLIKIDQYTDGSEQGKALGLLPFFHIMGLQALNLITPRFGAKVVTLPLFDPDMFIETLKTHQFTSIHLVTPLISFVINHPDLGREVFKNTNNIYSGATPSGEAMIQRLLEKIGHDVNFQEGYGMTELSPVSHSVLPTAKNTKVGSVGPPLPSTIVKVVDVESGRTLGPKEKGEICVKGPQLMSGYLNNPEATRNTIDSDGWLHTGDIGYYGEDKYFYVVDRLKELIKVKGLQVAPSELEQTLREHPKVLDAAVIGIPHAEWGEQPRAFVVKKDDSLTEEEVTTFVKDRLSRHKHLAGGVEFIDAVPKAPSGKILRRNLKEEYLDNDK